MSEENQSVEEVVTESIEENNAKSPDDGHYIAESKKYRKRAQDAERKLEAIEKQKLIDKEEFKTLAEKYRAELEESAPYKEKYEAMEARHREAQLSRLPEDKREAFKNTDSETLSAIVNMFEEKKAAETPSVRGSVGKQPPPEDWTSLNPSELRKNWTSIVNNAIKKSKT